MEYNDLIEYRGTFLENIIFRFHPMMRLPTERPLEWYESGNWILARNRKNDLSDQIGYDVNETYEEWIRKNGWENKIIGMKEMKNWARWAQKSVFTLLGLLITTVSLITGMPLGLMIGVPISLFSLYLKYLAVSDTIK